MALSFDGPRAEPWPLVSVVIPTYGRNERLTEAVRSVIDQTYPNIELIVVDDGSPTPATTALASLDTSGLTRATYIRHEENRGANAARNTGIRTASGEYVAFLDDDDRWDAAKISCQVRAFLSADPEVGLVYNGRRSESPNGTTVTSPSARGDVVKDLLTGESFGQFSSIMVRTDVISEAGLPDERFPAWQDREWLFRLAQHCHFKPVPKTLTYRRTELPDSITKRFEAKRDVAYPLFIEKHYELGREHGYWYARTFLATMRMNLARSAMRVGRYREGRKYFIRAFLANPLYRPVHPHLIASLGGKATYELAANLRRTWQTLVK